MWDLGSRGIWFEEFPVRERVHMIAMIVRDDEHGVFVGSIQRSESVSISRGVTGWLLASYIMLQDRDEL